MGSDNWYHRFSWNEAGRIMVARIACVLIGVCVGFVCATVIQKKDVPATGQVYITAAHIPSTALTGYSLMYADTERDSAYYLKEDYTYTYPDIGETVYFGKYSGVVESIEEGIGFWVEVTEDTRIYQGMSGMRVCDKDGNEIAFISKSKGGTRLLCVSLY